MNPDRSRHAPPRDPEPPSLRIPFHRIPDHSVNWFASSYLTHGVGAHFPSRGWDAARLFSMSNLISDNFSNGYYAPPLAPPPLAPGFSFQWTTSMMSPPLGGSRQILHSASGLFQPVRPSLEHNPRTFYEPKEDTKFLSPGSSKADSALTDESFDSAFEEDSCSRTTPVNHTSIRKWKQRSLPNGRRSKESTPPRSNSSSIVYSPITVQTSGVERSTGPLSAPVISWTKTSSAPSPPPIDKSVKSEVPVGIAVARQRAKDIESPDKVPATPLAPSGPLFYDALMHHPPYPPPIPYGYPMKDPPMFVHVPPPPAHAPPPPSNPAAAAAAAAAALWGTSSFQPFLTAADMYRWQQESWLQHQSYQSAAPAPAPSVTPLSPREFKPTLVSTPPSNDNHVDVVGEDESEESRISVGAEATSTPRDLKQSPKSIDESPEDDPVRIKRETEDIKLEVESQKDSSKEEEEEEPEANSGLVMLTKGIDHLEKLEAKSREQRPTRHFSCDSRGGLGLLIDAAATVTPTDLNENSKSTIRSKSLDSHVARSYKSQKSQALAKAFIASKSSRLICPEVGSSEKVADWEAKVRMNMADIQKKYRETYRELYKLEHSNRRSPSKSPAKEVKKRKLSTSSGGGNSPAKNPRLHKVEAKEPKVEIESSKIEVEPPKILIHPPKVEPLKVESPKESPKPSLNEIYLKFKKQKQLGKKSVESYRWEVNKSSSGPTPYATSSTTSLSSISSKFKLKNPFENLLRLSMTKKPYTPPTDEEERDEEERVEEELEDEERSERKIETDEESDSKRRDSEQNEVEEIPNEIVDEEPKATIEEEEDDDEMPDLSNDIEERASVRATDDEEDDAPPVLEPMLIDEEIPPKKSKKSKKNKKDKKERRRKRKEKREKPKVKFFNNDTPSEFIVDKDYTVLSPYNEDEYELPDCSLRESDLVNGTRVLTRLEGHFFPGKISAISPPDIYGVIIDKERGNKPHIFSREEVLKEAILEVKPRSLESLAVGTRVCAYWSTKYHHLYPGTVDEKPADSKEDDDFVLIELDDGDSREIHFEDIRLLPPNYPLVEYNPDPMNVIERKKRRQSMEDSPIKRMPKPFPKPPVLKVENLKIRKVAHEPETPNNVPKGIKPEPESKRSPPEKSKMAAFLPPQQLWQWASKGQKRQRGKTFRILHQGIRREDETIRIGDCAVFLSTGRPDRPYIGRLEGMWETAGGNMRVRVRWFYHASEARGIEEGDDDLKIPGALFDSWHFDENDVQTISHGCEVLSLDEYVQRLRKDKGRSLEAVYDNNDMYYLAGTFDPVAKSIDYLPTVRGRDVTT